FDALKDTYIRAGDGFVIVYSITSTSSFLEANETRERIYRVLEKETDEHIPIILVGNKLDLEDQRQTNICELYQIVLKDILETEALKAQTEEVPQQVEKKKRSKKSKLMKKLGCVVA
ncbi:Ras family protein, partial [Entamoeba invadens IP1]